MAPVLSLEILLGIEVRVKQNDCICRSEVDTLPAGAGGQQEEVVVGVGVEVVDLLPPIVLCNGAIDTADGPAAEFAGVVFQDIELGFELGEEEYFVAVLEEFCEEAVEEEHFAGGSDDGFVDGDVG